MGAPPLLDADHAEFIARPGISLSVASRGPGNLPELGRALGCRVAPDRLRVTVFLPGEQLPALVTAMRDTRTAAVVFSEPATHRTIQLKGVDATVERAAPADAVLCAQWADGFVAQLAPLGITEPLVRAFLWCEPGSLVAVTFTPCAAFQQTPGPRAGAPLAA